MRTLKLVLNGAEGLHARPAMDFVETARKFTCAIRISINDRQCNAKSIVGVLGLGGCRGDEIMITAEGDDEADAVGALADVVSAAA